MKKSVSLLLTVLMAMSIITVAATSVSAAETAKVNDKDCYVGQKVVYTYFLQAPGKAEDFQGQLEYTDGLSLEKVEISDASGVMIDGEKGVMVNTAISNNVYYSGVNINEGYDYTTKSAFITAEFLVEKSGDQTVANKLEILSGSNGTQYVEDYKAIEGVQSSDETTVQPVDAESVKLNVTAKTVYAGSKFTLKATVTPANADNKTLAWTSSNTKIATVSNGVVKGVKAGRVIITAKTIDGSNISAKCTVTVKQPVTRISLSKKATMYTGKKLTLKAKVNPANASNKALTWKSSNTKIAKVASNGVVTGVKAGTVKITATAKDGSRKSATCTVTVRQSVSKITLSKTNVVLPKKGSSYKVRVTVAPKNAYNKNVAVKSAKTKVAKVSASTVKSGKTVKITAVKKGKTKVVFTAKDGSKKSATCKVTVKK